MADNNHAVPFGKKKQAGCKHCHYTEVRNNSLLVYTICSHSIYICRTYNTVKRKHMIYT